MHGRETTLRVMTFNIRLGAISTTPAAVAAVIEAAHADIVGIQEAGWSLPAIADELGFYSQGGLDLGVLSRYPILPDAMQSNYVFVELAPDRRVAVSNVHLSPYPYGPYDLRDGLQRSVVLRNEQMGHMTEMTSHFEVLPALAEDVPVFLVGDFNVPSHLDWVEQARALHLGTVLEWPVSRRLQELGFGDSYRQTHPDPVVKPGYTWTPVPGAREVHDRIDFIYALGAAQLRESLIVGEGEEYADIVILPWPSDHRAVVSEYLLP